MDAVQILDSETRQHYNGDMVVVVVATSSTSKSTEQQTSVLQSYPVETQSGEPDQIVSITGPAEICAQFQLQQSDQIPFAQPKSLQQPAKPSTLQQQSIISSATVATY